MNARWSINWLERQSTNRLQDLLAKYSPAKTSKWARRLGKARLELVKRGEKPFRSVLSKKEAGALGGRSRSKAKVEAARKNAETARASGDAHRRRRYPACPSYKNHAHRFNPDGVCYGCRYDRYRTLGSPDYREYLDESWKRQGGL